MRDAIARHARTSEVFQVACNLEGRAREDYLAWACAGDDDLRAQVERMLEADVSDAGTGDLRVLIAETGARRSAGRRSAGAGDPRAVVRVGEYEILEEIGRGGMGAVYRARQQRPDRLVAIKLINPERLDAGSARRLAEEADLLGRLRHPGIAQVFGSGSAPALDASGRQFEQPFIAMELVEGRGLLEHVRGLDLRERLTLMADVCDAIQHAHQRGVVHLDLKPSNILVEGDGRPRVLDFGVGRALGPDGALASGDAQSLGGTFATMSPEQLAGSPEQIDTRADIFALGAVSFEVLSGQALREPRAGAGDAVLGLLTTPVRRLRAVMPKVPAEVDAIIARATEPDKERRYASAGEMGADIRRFLRDEPVLAMPAGLWRSARLFARRNRVMVGGALAAVLGLGLGLAALTIGLVRAHDSAARARLAHDAAQNEAANARVMGEFLKSSIFGIDPEEQGSDLSYLDALEYVAQRVPRDLRNAPEVEQDVRFNLGFIYRRHSMFDRAEEQVREALRLRRQLWGEQHEKTAEAYEELGYLVYVREGDAEQAEMLLERALGILRGLGLEASEDAGWQMLKIAIARIARDDLADVQTLLDDARKILVESYGEAFAARTTRWESALALARGDAQGSERLARRALALCDGVSEQDYIVARVELTLAHAIMAQGRTQGVNEHIERASRIFASLLVPEHVEIADVHEARARLHLMEGFIEDARLEAERCDALRRALLAPENPAHIESERLLTLASGEGEGELWNRLQGLFERSARSLGSDHRASLELLADLQRVALRMNDPVAIRQSEQMLLDLSNRRARRLGASIPPT